MIINRIEGQVFDGAGSLPYLDIGSSLDGADEWVPSIASSGGPAVILYTSGSTGQPKGICNDQRAILQRVAQATNSCHLNANDRFFLLSAPGTIAGVRETFAALLNGATLHVADPTTREDATVCNPPRVHQNYVHRRAPNILWPKT
jgi:non-ribosomal peptide synthetase component F